MASPKNIVADALSKLRGNGTQETTYESRYTATNISELYDIKELSKVKFSIIFQAYRLPSAVISIPNGNT